MTGIGDREVTGSHITVADAASDSRWHLRFRIDSYRAAPGALRTGYYEDWAVTATLFQGDPGPKVPVKGDFQHTGTLELTQTSTNLGGTIAGKFKISTTAFDEP